MLVVSSPPFVIPAYDKQLHVLRERASALANSIQRAPNDCIFSSKGVLISLCICILWEILAVVKQSWLWKLSINSQPPTKIFFEFESQAALLCNCRNKNPFKYKRKSWSWLGLCLKLLLGAPVSGDIRHLSEPSGGGVIWVCVWPMGIENY